MDQNLNNLMGSRVDPPHQIPSKYPRISEVKHEQVDSTSLDSFTSPVMYNRMKFYIITRQSSWDTGLLEMG
jgi:hypothetical protein